MEIIDFNPHTIQRRLSAGVEAKKATKSGSSIHPDHGEVLAKNQDSGKTPGNTEDLGDTKVVLEDKPDSASDPKRGELENRSCTVTAVPLEVPLWIPVDAPMRCHLPYTSYEIPIPLDLNMDFCIDVMMGQDTIVFMFVCGDSFVLVSVEANPGGAAG